MPRAVLVARCLNDPPVLRWICEAAKQLGTAPPSPAAAAADTAQQQPQQQGGRGSSRRSGGGVPAGAVGRGKLTSFLSFYAAVVCEVVMEAKVSEPRGAAVVSFVHPSSYHQRLPGLPRSCLGVPKQSQPGSSDKKKS